ncbi:MAG: AlpA family phage regulatory protein [Pseudomonadota bacterium]
MAQQLKSTPARLLRRREVETRTGLGRSQLYALMAEGQFPKQVHIKGTASVAWSENSINEWIASQIGEAA